MIEIDGSLYSGSGTLLRYGTSLATLTGKPLHMVRIRARRPKPGLRAQHLSALSACATISGGRLDNARVGSQEITYYPGSLLDGGTFSFDIGTAGSATMAAFTLIPPRPKRGLPWHYGSKRTPGAGWGRTGRVNRDADPKT